MSKKVHIGVNRAYGKGYRYYSPTLARWLSRDPIGEKGAIAPRLFLLQRWRRSVPAAPNRYDFLGNQIVDNGDLLGLVEITGHYLDSFGHTVYELPEGMAPVPATKAPDPAAREEQRRLEGLAYPLVRMRPKWNPSGHAKICEATAMGFFFGVGVEFGNTLLRFDNGQCQRYHYIGSGVGLSIFNIGRGAAGSLAFGGDVYGVYGIEDFTGGFLSASGHFLAGAIHSTGAAGELSGEHVASRTVGLGIPGITGTYQGFWTTGDAYPCCSDCSPAPEGKVECCPEQ